MKLDWLILADAAQTVGGKLYLLGGGWDSLIVNTLPAQQVVAIAVGIEVKWTETNEQHKVELHMEDQDGNQLMKIEGAFEVGRPPGIAPGQSQRFQLAVPTPITFNQLGTYVVKVLFPDEKTRELTEQSRTSFRVVPSPMFNLRQQGKSDEPNPEGNL
jgi:hypothetical protein